MGYIYKITNLITSKAYIGQTITDLTTRYGSHLRSATLKHSDKDNCKYYTELNKDLRKYTVCNFKIEQIEECDNSLLNEREDYWINYYDTYNNGYNNELGHCFSHKCTKEKLLEVWNEGKSVAEIANDDRIKLNRNTISILLKKLGISQKEINNRGYKKVGKNNSKKIYVYDKNKNFIKEYNSTIECSKDLLIRLETIYSAITSKSLCANKYYFLREKGEKI